MPVPSGYDPVSHAAIIDNFRRAFLERYGIPCTLDHVVIGKAWIRVLFGESLDADERTTDEDLVLEKLYKIQAKTSRNPTSHALRRGREEASVARRKLWSGEVETRWEPRHGLFREDPETIAREVLAGHDGNLAASVSSINFYVNRAGANLSERDIARLKRARAIVQRSGRSAGVPARMAANAGLTNADVHDFVRALVADRQWILNKDHTINDLLNFLQHPDEWRSYRTSNPGASSCGCSSCSCGPDCRCSCCCERVEVLCGCGWGSLSMKINEVPPDCPVCGLKIGTREERTDELPDQAPNPARSLTDEENHLSHGFYMVSEKTARQLARAARKRVSSREKLRHLRDPRDRTMLPSAGFELLVEHDGELYWLAQTPYQGRMVWSVRKKD